MALKRGTEIPTIDCTLITITPESGNEIALDTASEIKVEPQIETQEAVKLIVKGVLKAQKPEVAVVTGNTITLTDNVFTPELVKLLQGGKIEYWTSEAQITSAETETAFGVAKYTPPVSGQKVSVKPFTLKAYSAQYDTAGLIVNYECITYPNCQGIPLALGAKDNEFRVAEYTIKSAPKKTEAPYVITYHKSLPTIS